MLLTERSFYQGSPLKERVGLIPSKTHGNGISNGNVHFRKYIPSCQRQHFLLFFKTHINVFDRNTKKVAMWKTT
jgi:hypothetical protein